VPIDTLGKLLDRALEFNSELERRYAAIRDESPDNDARLLTYCLCRHRRDLQKALKALDPELMGRVRDSGLERDAEFHPETEFLLIKTPPNEVKAHILIEAVIECGLGLISLYRSVLRQPFAPDVTGFIERLIDGEERNVAMLEKMLAIKYC